MLCRQGRPGCWSSDRWDRTARASGRFNDIYRYWFGDIDRPAVPLRTVRRFALIVGLPVLLLLAGSVIWGRVLRHQVGVRTVQLRDELAEKRRAETLLRESEHLLQTVIRNANIMVCTQPNLRFTWVYNPTVPTSAGSLIGRTDADVWPAAIVPP